MKRVPTVFARGVVYLVGIAALLVCLILLPELAREEMAGKPSSADITLPFLSGAYLLATPFFVALYQSHKLLTYIDNNKVFSDQSINALRIIKICSFVFAFLVIAEVIAGAIVAKSMNPTEDITFMFTFGFIFIFTAIVIAVFVAVLQKLLADAVAMKSENDLIV